SIYDAMQSLDYAAAGKTSLLLLVMSFLVLAITYTLQRNIWVVWPKKS
ncbi:MAG: molybdate ABC transporter permease subunit, partial [Acidobacteria bacterium]